MLCISEKSMSMILVLSQKYLAPALKSGATYDNLLPEFIFRTTASFNCVFSHFIPFVILLL